MSLHTLSADGVGLVVEVSDDRLPRIVHWGRDPGPVPPMQFDNSALPLLPTQHDGWMGRPAVSAGTWPHLRLRTTALEVGTDRLSATAEDGEVRVESIVELTPDGMVKMRHTLTNIGEASWAVNTLRCVLPIPDDATQLMDFAGRWALERVPQRSTFGFGAHVRENRRGRTGHDAAMLLCVQAQQQVWAVHIGWSGNHEHTAERLPDSVGALGGGELLEPGEVRLSPGESYAGPWAYFAYSSNGLDGIRDRFHRYVRSRPNHPRTPRPVVLNTWEAVYFEHDVGKLKRLADVAARVGVERFVLDDGWFGGRRDDSAGLGDWHVAYDGFDDLVKHVHSLGMQFGLWFEPEMVNPDSDLFRAHPDWTLSHPDRMPAPYRNQHVLNVADPNVFDYLLGRLDDLVSAYGVDFIKWDHNRDLAEPRSVHAQTIAVYQLLDTLRERHPNLEIESCSSGGARIDLGILERTDRVWTSDTNDPIDRQQIQLWTGLLLPPELLGSHVGAAHTHITGRVTDLPIRCATALFAHAGVEWDLTACPESELEQLAEWIALYKRHRSLIHSGRSVVADTDPSMIVHGVIGPDSALFSYAQLSSAPAHSPIAYAPMRLRLPGLAGETAYQVDVALGPAGGTTPPSDWDNPLALPVTMTGAALAAVGLPIKRLKPADAIVLQLTKVSCGIGCKSDCRGGRHRRRRSSPPRGQSVLCPWIDDEVRHISSLNLLDEELSTSHQTHDVHTVSVMPGRPGLPVEPKSTHVIGDRPAHMPGDSVVHIAQ